jgi:hypothetical protein
MRDSAWKQFQVLDIEMRMVVELALCASPATTTSTAEQTRAYLKYLPLPNWSLARLKLSEFLCIKIW